MSNEEFTSSIRKFLKHLGVTGHQLIEDELRKAVKDGKIDTGSKVEVDAEITIKNLDFQSSEGTAYSLMNLIIDKIT